MRTARRYRISGRVQGVGFRYFTQAAAARENLHGWVRNLPDGRVEAAFEGEVDAVEAMVRWAHAGPRQAVIVHLEVIDEQPKGETSFRVG